MFCGLWDDDPTAGPPLAHTGRPQLPRLGNGGGSRKFSFESANLVTPAPPPTKTPAKGIAIRDSNTEPGTDARRAALLARIAKNNGTTLDEAAAGVTSSGQPTPSFVGEDLSRQPANSAAPSNPFITALATTAVISLGIGLILLLVGTWNLLKYAGSGDSGIGELAWGGSLTGFGTTTLMLLVTAKAVIWQLRQS